MENAKTRWYKDAVIYQIYPRSFMDSNGDGIGDINGICSKLDYLKDLGINAVWLSPCYKSPNADNGYDISNYRDIMDEFGTLEDWKEMLKQMHDRGIKLIMDLVVNHTSDEHKWFIESKKSTDNPYRDYYIWRKGRGKNGKRPPNNWTSRFGGSAWKYDETTAEWYLHLFNAKQPDLNWDNPKVRKEVGDLVKYWLDLGVDGFRCDVITYISKREGLPNGKFNPFICGDEHFTHGPHIHEYLHELYVNVLSHYDCMTVGEAAGVTVEEGLAYTDEKNEELDTVFQFQHVEVDTYSRILPRKLDLRRLKRIFSRWQNGLAGKSWNSLYYENHDQPRSLPRYVGDYGKLRREAAKMLAVSIHMQQGTPYVYQGQEIGMTNCPFNDISEYEDVLVRTIYGIMKKIHLPFGKKLLMWVMSKSARDHSRTPMQWDDSLYGGFSTAKPWLKVNPNYKEINVEQALSDDDSILNFYKKLIALRKGKLKNVIKQGVYKEYYPGSKDIYVYERCCENEKLFVICNFKNKSVDFKLPPALIGKNANLVLSNYDNSAELGDVTLRPYESLIYYIK